MRGPVSSPPATMPQAAIPTAKKVWNFIIIVIIISFNLILIKIDYIDDIEYAQSIDAQCKEGLKLIRIYLKDKTRNQIKDIFNTHWEQGEIREALKKIGIFLGIFPK